MKIEVYATDMGDLVVTCIECETLYDRPGSIGYFELEDLVILHIEKKHHIKSPKKL